MRGTSTAFPERSAFSGASNGVRAVWAYPLVAAVSAVTARILDTIGLLRNRRVACNAELVTTGDQRVSRCVLARYTRIAYIKDACPIAQAPPFARPSMPAAPLRVVRPDVVYERLQDLIIRGRLAPGVRVVENDIAARLGVSRTPVREAIQRLHQEGMLRATAVARRTEL